MEVADGGSTISARARMESENGEFIVHTAFQ